MRAFFTSQRRMRDDDLIDPRNRRAEFLYRTTASTGFESSTLAAKLMRRLFEMVRSMIAPQLMHFQA
jgi:hypothetical protein